MTIMVVAPSPSYASGGGTPTGPLIEDHWLPESVFILGKATTFELLSSAMEAAIFMAFYGGAGGAAGYVFVFTLTTAFTIYMVHEYVWESFLDPATDRADETIVAARATTYRILSLIRSYVAASIFGDGGHGASGVIFAVVVSVADTVLFVVHDLIFVGLRNMIYGAAPAAPAAAR